MNFFQKSESIKAGLRKSFQDGSSKMARRRCYGYQTVPDGTLVIDHQEAGVVLWIFQQYKAGKSLGKIALALKNREFSLQRESKDGIGKQLTSCSPMKNIQAVYSFRKRLAPALSKLKMMASLIGISTPTLMRPLFLMNCLGRYSKKSVTVRKIRLQDFP